MRTALAVVGVMVMLMGIVWFCQGINLLPGSFMSGQTRWAVNGVIALALGLVLIIASRRRRRT
jgi:uncharacterized membrane protein HdeD (DUF308 family)